MAWSESHFTFLNLTLQAFCLITCTSWCYLSKLWTISRSNFCTVLIHAFNRYWVWFAYKLLVWSEGYCTIWRNRVSSLSWNHFFLASIFEGWLNCFINWNQWVATLEGWGSSLRKALRACASCTSSCRSDLSKLWTVSRSDWGAILIYTFDCDWIWVSDKLFVWSEGYCTVWCNRVGSLTWNSLLFASIFEGWLNCFIDWNQWITTLEGWSTSLRKALRTCASCTSSCRSDLSEFWTVSCSNFCTIFIHTFHGDWIWFTNELLAWREGYSSIWCNRISSLAWNSLLFASIFEGWFNRFIDWN